MIPNQKPGPDWAFGVFTLVRTLPHADTRNRHNGAHWRNHDSNLSKQETAMIPTEPKTLSREALEEIACYAQAGLLLESDVWSLDKDVNGSDFISHMTEILSKHGLVPVCSEDEGDNVTRYLEAEGHWVPVDPNEPGE